MGQVIILPETTKQPITLIGERAGICWGADTSDPEANYKRGWDCITSGHGRTLEFVNVEMVLDGYSARVIREWYTHIGGAPTRLQASTRYIDYGEFDYVVPPSIREHNGYDDALMIYDAAMETISNSMQQLESKGIPREDIALLLPLGMTTRIVDKRNLRNLIDMSRQRMCNRAYWEFREMFSDIKDALCLYSDEWARVIAKTFIPKCAELGYCPEKHGCGKYPGRANA
jgi:thymidylate synthase (FAD)